MPSIRGLLFRIIYRTYLWSAKSNTSVGANERIIEYPFAIKNLINQEGRVLIVGCSGDILSTILPELGYATWGIDIKYVPVKYHNFTFIQGDIRSTNFPDLFFDIIIAISTIEHVGMYDNDREGDRKAVKEMLRILKPGGILIVTFPCAKNMYYDKFQRIYDIDSIKELFRDMHIVELLFYKKDANGMWIKTEPEELSQFVNSVDSAAMLKLRKKSTDLQ